MIQLNLLPAVKQEFIRAQRTKHIMVSTSLIAIAAALGVLVVSLSAVYGVQRKAINDLSADIASASKTLKSTPNITDILTVQSQLNSLAVLNQQKPVASRLFGYLSLITPKQATISNLHVDYAANTMTISGGAPSLDVVNAFVDGLKFTNYTIEGVPGTLPAFNAVVLSSFSRTSKSATYAINLNFNPIIFNVSDNVTLTVGKTAPLPEQPSIIFKKES